MITLTNPLTTARNLVRIARDFGYNLRVLGKRGRKARGTGPLHESPRHEFAKFLADNRVGPSARTNYVYLTQMLNRGFCPAEGFAQALTAFHAQQKALTAISEVPAVVAKALQDHTPSALSAAGQRQYKRVRNFMRIAEKSSWRLSCTNKP